MAFELGDRLKESFRQLIQPPLRRGGHRARVLAVASGKGGVGKTTTAINLALTFAARGKQTLLLDLDPQAHVSESLQLAPPPSAEGVGDVFCGRLREINEVSWPTRFPHLRVAGSDKRLADIEASLASKIGRELILAQALETTRTHYDLIVIDCPPNLGTLTLNALSAADQLLVPTDPSQLALAGVADILSALDTLQRVLARPTQLLGIVTTRLDARMTGVNRSLKKSLGELWGDKLLRTTIPQASAINRAHMEGIPLRDLAPRSRGALAYGALADELAPHLGLTSSPS